MLSKAFDNEMHQMAVNDWEVFKDLIGQPAVKRAMVVVLRKRGLSYGQIATRLAISKQSAQQIYYRWHTSQTVKVALTAKIKLR